MLAGALTRTHIATVQANAAEALQAAARLRAGLRGSQAEMAVALLVMQTEVQAQAAGAREEQLRRVFADTSHTITLGNVHGAMAVQLSMQRAEHADELTCLRHGMVAAERSWAAERSELLAAFERVAASRRAAADARREQALDQMREHYALLVRQRQAWVAPNPSPNPNPNPNSNPNPNPNPNPTPTPNLSCSGNVSVDLETFAETCGNAILGLAASR